MTARSVALFAAAALAEIGGAYLVWVGLRQDKGALYVVLGTVALAGKGIRPASIDLATASAGTHASAVATLTVRPKAKIRRKLSRRGRARVTVSVTYIRTGLDPVTKKVKLTLRKNRR